MVGFGSHSSVAEHWHLKPGILGLIHNSDLLLTLFILPHNIKDPTIEYPLSSHIYQQYAEAMEWPTCKMTSCARGYGKVSIACHRECIGILYTPPDKHRFSLYCL